MKLLILGSHPVQYHAPVFRKIAESFTQAGDDCRIVYLSDFSLRGYRDRGFDTAVAWDEPLLEGYTHTILRSGMAAPQRFWDLGAPGWEQLIERERPDRLLVTTLNYRGTVWATLQARAAGIPCTLRVETSDVALPRSPLKSWARTQIYRQLYRLFDSAIAIGTHNRDHLLHHGLPSDRVTTAYYSVPDRFSGLSWEEKQRQRSQLRSRLGWDESHMVLLFCGKLIPKKQPQLLLEARSYMPTSLGDRLAILYVGSGELAASLQAAAAGSKYVHFAGFQNQLDLPPYYLAADVLVLPSLQMGETWGLVVNEALHAGLPCIVTEAVGCAADFTAFPDFQILPSADAAALARAIAAIADKPRDFARYALMMADFTVETSARRIADFLRSLNA